jgi:histidinol dehydrogenase
VQLQLDPAIREAFDVAYDNIYAFHVAQKSVETNVENMKVCQYCLLVIAVTLLFIYLILKYSEFPRVSNANELQEASHL